MDIFWNHKVQNNGYYFNFNPSVLKFHWDFNDVHIGLWSADGLHLFQECSAASISPAIADKLFRSLEECDNSSVVPGSDDDIITSKNQTYELAVACLVKIIHLIHHADLKNQHQVCELLNNCIKLSGRRMPRKSRGPSQ